MKYSNKAKKSKGLNSQSESKISASSPARGANISSGSLGTDSVSDAGTSTSVSSLGEVIDESKLRLAEESPIPVRKRGRPPGSKKKSGEDDAGIQASSEQTVTPPSEPAPDLAPILAPAVKFAFSIPARNTGFEGFKATDEEAQEIANHLDQCIKQYMPQISEKASIAVVALGTICFVTAVKYNAYTEWLEDKKSQKPSNDQSEPSQPSEKEKEQIRYDLDLPPVTSRSFFPQVNQ